MENTAELLKVLHHDEKIDNVCGDENNTYVVTQAGEEKRFTC